jgi:hypothetical protein
VVSVDDLLDQQIQELGAKRSTQLASSERRLQMVDLSGLPWGRRMPLDRGLSAPWPWSASKAAGRQMGWNSAFSSVIINAVLGEL